MLVEQKYKWSELCKKYLKVLLIGFYPPGSSHPYYNDGFPGPRDPGRQQLFGYADKLVALFGLRTPEIPHRGRRRWEGTHVGDELVKNHLLIYG